MALKAVPLMDADKSDGATISAIREISILRMIKHENVVKLYGVATSDDIHSKSYMVLDYCLQVDSHSTDLLG